MGSTDKGWIKLYRKLLSDEIWTSSEPFDKRSAWIDLLLMAEYKGHSKESISKNTDTLPGQVITSYSALSRRWRWSRWKVRNFLRQCTHIHTDRVNRQGDKLAITVENWALYQGGNNGNRQGKPTDKPTPRSIYKEEVKKNTGLEPQNAAPSEEENDDDGMTVEEWRATWEYTDSTEKMQNDSSANKG